MKLIIYTKDELETFTQMLRAVYQRPPCLQVLMSELGITGRGWGRIFLKVRYEENFFEN